MKQLILITPEVDHELEQALIIKCLSEPDTALHIRKPGYSLEQLSDYLHLLPPSLYAKTLIHAHPQLLSQFPLKGFHVTEYARTSWQFNLLQQHYGQQFVSTAVHELKDIPAVIEQGFQYSLLSPIFTSISKAGYESKFEWNSLCESLMSYKNQKETAAHGFIALGGIQEANIAQINHSPFSGAAVLGAVWQSPDPYQTWLSLRNILH